MDVLAGVSSFVRFASLTPSSMASCIAFGRLDFFDPPEGDVSGDRFVPFDDDSSSDFDFGFDFEGALEVVAFAAGLAKYDDISLEVMLIVLRNMHCLAIVQSGS